MPYSDIDIQHLFEAEDEQSMALIYDRYSTPLYGIIIRMCNGDDTSANDILQDVFVKVWKKRASFKSSRSKLFTWMYAIARNTSIDYMRSKARHQHDEIQNATLNVSQSMDVESLDLSVHVNDLEEKYKVMVEELYFKGMTQQEVADKYQMPLGTVKSRIKIALKELRRKYLVVATLFTLISQLL